MARKTGLRRFAVGLVAVLAVVIGVFAHSSSATTRLTVFSDDGTYQCASGTVPAAYQDSRLGLEFGQFDSNEPIYLEVTFPDGRVFTIDAAAYVDGVADLPVNFWYEPIPTDNGGAVFRIIRVGNTVPYGCYRFTANAPQSGRRMTSDFAIKPRPQSAPAINPAQLRIEDRTTGATSSQHGAAVNIIGSGFRAQERVYIWITAPDGAVLSWPEQFESDQLITNNYGEFVATFEFSSYNPTGEYKFTAKGSTSGYLVIAPFRLTSRTTPLKGWAALRVAYPGDGADPQRKEFEIQGDRFEAYERIDIWMTLPDGSVRGLPSQFADLYGNFFVVLDTDERLPIGTYSMTAKGAISGSTVITQFRVQYAGGTEANIFEQPSVIDSNWSPLTDGGPRFDTRTEGDIGSEGAESSPGPICDATNNFCQ